VEPIIDRGLNLSEPDHLSQDELDAFNTHYATWDGRPHIGMNFWPENGRPDILKRYRLFARYLGAAPKTALNEDSVGKILANANHIAAQCFGTCMWYSLLGFEAGVRYPINGAQRTGYSRDMIVEGLGISCMYSSTRGMETIALALNDYAWTEPTEPPAWRNGWAPDHDAFVSGLDFSTPGMSSREVTRLEDWYDRNVGEVPRFVRFMTRHNPELLKAYRNRYENLLKLLPKQVMPTTLIYIHGVLKNWQGLRQNVLLAKNWGVDYEELMNALWAPAIYYEIDAGVDHIYEAVGDVLDNWEGAVPEARTEPGGV
jgi:hypothetical protein